MFLFVSCSPPLPMFSRFVGGPRGRRQPLERAAVARTGAAWLLVHFSALLFGESDQQQIERKIREMAAAVKTADLDRIFRHISDDFRYRNHDKPAFRQKADEVMRKRKVDEVVV